MHVKANAFQEYNQAAILDKMLSNLPEIARAMAESFNKVDKITIVSSGDGGGASALTGEMTRMVAQVPVLIETLTGMKITDLIDRLQGLGNRQPPPANGASDHDPRSAMEIPIEG